MILRYLTCFFLIAGFSGPVFSQTVREAVGTVTIKESRPVAADITWRAPLLASDQPFQAQPGRYPIYKIAAIPQAHQAAYNGSDVGILTEVQEGVSGFLPLDLNAERDELAISDLGVFFERAMTLDDENLQIHPNLSVIQDFQVLRPIWRHLQEDYIVIAYTGTDGTSGELLLEPEEWGVHNLAGANRMPKQQIDTAQKIALRYVHPNYPETPLLPPVNSYDIIPDAVVVEPLDGFWTGRITVADKMPSGYDYRLLDMRPEPMPGIGIAYNQSNGEAVIKATQAGADQGRIDLEATYPHPVGLIAFSEPVAITYDTGAFSRIVLFLSATRSFATYDIMLIILAACILGGLIGVSITYWNDGKKIQAREQEIRRLQKQLSTEKQQTEPLQEDTIMDESPVTAVHEQEASTPTSEVPLSAVDRPVETVSEETREEADAASEDAPAETAEEVETAEPSYTTVELQETEAEAPGGLPVTLDTLRHTLLDERVIEPYLQAFSAFYQESDKMITIIEKDFGKLHELCVHLKDADLPHSNWKAFSDILIIVQRFIEFYPRMTLNTQYPLVAELAEQLRECGLFENLIDIFEQERRISIERITLFETSFDHSRHNDGPSGIRLITQNLSRYFDQDITTRRGTIYEVTRAGYKASDGAGGMKSQIVFISSGP